MTCNKILIFGLPRTKTTMVQMHLARVTNLLSLSEPYSGTNCGGKDDVYVWTRNQPSCIIKLLTINLIDNPDLNFFKLWHCGFDRLVVTGRRNLTDAAVSLYYAEKIANQYHYLPGDQRLASKFTIDLPWLENWCKNLNVWFTVLNKLEHSGISYDYVEYEDYATGQEQTLVGYRFNPAAIKISFVDPELNYKELCDNYLQVRDLISRYAATFTREN